MYDEKIAKLFAKASKADKTKFGYITSEELERKLKLDGAKTFKRKALGFCGFKTVKSLEQLGRLLYETGIVNSVEEGKGLVPSLVGKSIPYNCRAVAFDEVFNSKHEKAYKIWTFCSLTDTA